MTSDMYKSINLLFSINSGWSGCPVVPVNTVVKQELPYAELWVIPSNKGINLRSKSGLLHLVIKVPAGKGLLAASEIADSFDELLQGRLITLDAETVVQFFQSGSTPKPSSSNAGTFELIYAIPFNMNSVRK